MILRRWVAFLSLCVAGVGVSEGTSVPAAHAVCAEPVTTLVLYDSTGQFGGLGERYATMTANLVSRFGSWRAEPVADYVAGDLACAKAGVYIGSTYDEPLPDAFLDDVAGGATPVMWVWENLWKLNGRLPIVPGTGPDKSVYDQVQYKGQSLSRTLQVDAGLATQSLGPEAEVLATASGPQTAPRPWATRRGSLIYLAENPLAYISGTDRYLVFNDLLFELLAPDTAERHRALVRLEDVSPNLDASLVRASVKALVDEDIPFAIAVIAEYHDGKGGEVIRLSDRPELVKVLQDAVDNGATLVMHGLSHQIDGLENPYSGETAADYEFFRATTDADDNVKLLGPVEGDSYESAKARLQQGINEFVKAGLPRPRVITPPHYAASAEAYRAMRDLFVARFDRGLYFDGQLSTGVADPTRFYDQFFAYPVTDVYGMTVVPENLGNESPTPLNNRPARGVAELVASAKAALVVRDGFAAFFWHPYLVTQEGVGVENLHEIVQQLQGLGYTFVGLPDVVPEAAAGLGVVTPPDTSSPIRAYLVLAGAAVAGAVVLRTRTRRRVRR